MDQLFSVITMLAGIASGLSQAFPQDVYCGSMSSQVPSGYKIFVADTGSAPFPSLQGFSYRCLESNGVIGPYLILHIPPGVRYRV
ncbi:MAG TPA: hypothetical protein VN701_01505 [Candidatus Paceibacterota bacterium]|nr:hypothetical protein [Candidatus Paceibacterota bacterium]